MRNEHRVIDADAHVMEPDDLWPRYIRPSLKHRAPRRASPEADELWGQLEVDGTPIYRKYPLELVRAFQANIDRNYPEYKAAGFDSASYIRALDSQGVDMAFLYPSLTLGLLAIDGQDPELAEAIAAAYNDWLADFCRINPERLRGVGVVSLHRPADAEREIERIVREYKFLAVTVRPNLLGGRTLGDPAYDRFWSICEELGVAVGIHEGAHTRLPAAGADRFDSHLAMHTCCHPMEQMMAFVALYESGTLQRHPRLRVGFLEAGCGWVPYLLWRMEGEYALWRFQVPHLREGPKETFLRQCFVSAEGCEPYVRGTFAELGDKLLFGSDFPHPDHAHGEELAEWFAPTIDDASRRKVLSDNPGAFYGLAGPWTA